MRLSFHRSDLRRAVKAGSANCKQAFVGVEEGHKFVIRGSNINEKFVSTVSTIVTMKNVEGSPVVPTTKHVVNLQELADALDSISGNSIVMDFGDLDIEMSSEVPEQARNAKYYDTISYQPWDSCDKNTMTKPTVVPAANFAKMVGLSLSHWDYRDIDKMQLCIQVWNDGNIAKLIYDNSNAMVPTEISNTMHLQMVPESWSARINIDYINNICKSLPSKSLLSLSVSKKLPILEVEAYLNDMDSVKYYIVQLLERETEYDYKNNGMI